jgi:hypothetical protein
LASENLKKRCKIKYHILYCQRPNVLYARLRRNCSSLKYMYDLFRSNIITDSRCVCGYIAFSWTTAYISNNGQFSLIFCTTTIFGKILELCYLETLKKTRLKIFCYQMQYRHSLRTVGDSLKEHNSPLLPLNNIYICLESDLKWKALSRNKITKNKISRNKMYFVLKIL